MLWDMGDFSFSTRDWIPTPLTVEAQRLNHWIAREIPKQHFFFFKQHFLSKWNMVK